MIKKIILIFFLIRPHVRIFLKKEKEKKKTHFRFQKKKKKKKKDSRKKKINKTLGLRKKERETLVRTPSSLLKTLTITTLKP